MTDELLKLLSYAPEVIIGILVIWYSLELQKRYQASMDKRDLANQTSLERRDAAYLGTLSKISDSIAFHDSQEIVRFEQSRKDAAEVVENAADRAAAKVLQVASAARIAEDERHRNERSGGKLS